MSNDLERQADYVAARCGWASANEMRDCIRHLTKKPALVPVQFQWSPASVYAAGDIVTTPDGPMLITESSQ